MIKKECIVCGETKIRDYNDIDCCCGYSMFPKEDVDMFRETGWRKRLKMEITTHNSLDCCKNKDCKACGGKGYILPQDVEEK
jgi:hypothetical protein